jgi:hypothetical protein
MQSPTWKAVAKGGNIWGTLTISATLVAVQDDGTMMPLSMTTSFMCGLKRLHVLLDAAEDGNFFGLFFFALHHIS